MRAARGATEHLRPCGQQGTDRLRTAGYHQALATAGPPFDAGLVVAVEAYHWRDGAEWLSG